MLFDVLTYCHTLQKFAEKPKGKELDAMKVDTTVLGVLLLSLPMHCMLCYWYSLRQVMSYLRRSMPFETKLLARHV